MPSNSEDDESVELEQLNKEYKNLNQDNKKWNFYLLACCLIVTFGASFQFGYNISVLNTPTIIFKDFIKNNFYMFNEYNNKLKLNNESDVSVSVAEYILVESENITQVDNDNDSKLEPNISSTVYVLNEARVDQINEFIWTIINSLFVVGGMTGALTSKSVLDYLGRKKGILLNLSISIVASIIAFISPYVKSPVCIMVSRLLYGIQGGMMCSLIPTYLSEISPDTLRGQANIISSLFLTFGLFFAQILGFRQILGTEHLWHYLLAFPFIPSFFSGIIFLLVFPESPKTLVLTEKNMEKAKKTLQLLRGTEDVDEELEEIQKEQCSDEYISLIDLFKRAELRWQLLTSLMLQVVQQFCGINAIAFYSSSIFREANIKEEFIQYAVATYGLFNFFATILCIPLIDKFGRKPLLVYPMLIIIVDFILLTIFLHLKAQIFAYLSISCILIFVISFSVGLGPIPFIYAAEVFKQDARSSAMAVNVFVNWLCSLFITMAFPYMQKALKESVFLVFMVFVIIFLLFIMLLQPETKGMNPSEIVWKVRKNIASRRSDKKIMKVEK